MAYLKEIWSRCDHNQCVSKAVVTLHTWRNELIGQFCRKHGNAKLHYQKDVESAGAAVDDAMSRLDPATLRTARR